MTRTLSPRQTELLNLLNKGLTAHEAAKKMNISLGTVQTYLVIIRAKLHRLEKLKAIKKGSEEPSSINADS